MEKKAKRWQKLLSAARTGRSSQRDSLSLPTGILGLTPYLTLRGRTELEVFGCLSILGYEEDQILLQMTKGYLRIRGKGLSMRTYHRSAMTVCGEIATLDFPKEEAEALSCLADPQKDSLKDPLKGVEE